MKNIFKRNEIADMKWCVLPEKGYNTLIMTSRNQQENIRIEFVRPVTMYIVGPDVLPDPIRLASRENYRLVVNDSKTGELVYWRMLDGIDSVYLTVKETVITHIEKEN